MKDISNKKAYILVWIVFLLFFLSVSFIYISTKISTYIGESDNLSLVSDTKYNFLASMISTWTTEDVYSFFPDNSYTGNLRQNAKTEYRFTWNTATSANLILSNSGVVSYKILLVDSSFAVWTLSFSWLTSTWFTNLSIPLSSSNPTAIVYLKNLWWNLNYNISSTSSFQAEKRGYSISKLIGWKTYTKTVWEITNFAPWYLTGTFDLAKYQTYGLYSN